MKCIKVEGNFYLCTEGGSWWKYGSERGEEPTAQFARSNGENNPKTSNSEDISLFKFSVTERRPQQRAECCQGQWHNRKYWRTWQVVSYYGRKKRWCYENWWVMRHAYGKT